MRMAGTVKERRAPTAVLAGFPRRNSIVSHQYAHGAHGGIPQHTSPPQLSPGLVSACDSFPFGFNSSPNSVHSLGTKAMQSFN